MIGWLQGTRIDNWQQSAKQGIVLVCGGIGYEIQLIPRDLATISSEEELSFWIHCIKRDDSDILYGFIRKEERDLFRLLIGISGVGPQIAISLIDQVGTNDLINAIVDEDTHSLTKAQGIGKRIAERIFIELRHKINELRQHTNQTTGTNQRPIQKIPSNNASMQEVKEALKAIGYEDHEINKAIHAAIKKHEINPNGKNADISTGIQDAEALIKESLVWLSNESG